MGNNNEKVVEIPTKHTTSSFFHSLILSFPHSIATMLLNWLQGAANILLFFDVLIHFRHNGTNKWAENKGKTNVLFGSERENS